MLMHLLPALLFDTQVYLPPSYVPGFARRALASYLAMSNDPLLRKVNLPQFGWLKAFMGCELFFQTPLLLVASFGLWRGEARREGETSSSSKYCRCWVAPYTSYTPCRRCLPGGPMCETFQLKPCLSSPALRVLTLRQRPRLPSRPPLRDSLRNDDPALCTHPARLSV